MLEDVIAPCRRSRHPPPEPKACDHPTLEMCCHAAIGAHVCTLLPKISGQRAQLCTRQARDLRFLNGAENAWLKGENNITTIYFLKLKMNVVLCGIQFSGGKSHGPLHEMIRVNSLNRERKNRFCKGQMTLGSSLPALHPGRRCKKLPASVKRNNEHLAF